jgi:hypothetical protein
LSHAFAWPTINLCLPCSWDDICAIIASLLFVLLRWALAELSQKKKFKWPKNT